MLQDGLLSERHYEDLTYTSTLFMQIHDLICMYNPTLNKGKVIEISFIQPNGIFKAKKIK